MVSRESLRAILRGAGIASPRRRRPPRYRSRRPRMGAEGTLLQLDGSRHRWLEKRGPELVLVGAIDDATGWGHGRAVPRPGGRRRLPRDPADHDRRPRAAGGHLSRRSQCLRPVEPEPDRSRWRRSTQPGRTGPGRARDRLDPGRLTPGQGPGRANVGHLPGSAGGRAAPGRGQRPGRRQRLPGRLSGPPQRALQRPGARPRGGLAAAARRHPSRSGPRLGSTAARLPGTTPSRSTVGSCSCPAVQPVRRTMPASGSRSTSPSTARSWPTTASADLPSSRPRPIRVSCAPRRGSASSRVSARRPLRSPGHHPAIIPGSGSALAASSRSD